MLSDLGRGIAHSGCSVSSVRRALKQKRYDICVGYLHVVAR